MSPPPAIQQKGDESFERPADADLAGKRHGEHYQSRRERENQREKHGVFLVAAQGWSS